jgi:hypothetical protein
MIGNSGKNALHIINGQKHDTAPITTNGNKPLVDKLLRNIEIGLMICPFLHPRLHNLTIVLRRHNIGELNKGGQLVERMVFDVMGEVYAIGILDEGGTVLDAAFEDFARLG